LLNAVQTSPQGNFFPLKGIFSGNFDFNVFGPLCKRMQEKSFRIPWLAEALSLFPIA
jgi:hypothetical protein